MRYLLMALLLFLHLIINAQDSLYFISATTGAACQEVEYHNGYLFAGTGSTFRVYDATQPLPYPVLFEYRYRSFLADFCIRGSYLYIAANNDGVSKWDISSPGSPLEVSRYVPNDFGEAAHDLSFYGDTLVVAAHKKVVLLYDNGTTLNKINEFGGFAGNGFISGGDTKGSLYAYTLGRNGSNDGVYLYDLSAMNQVAYVQQSYCDPENVIFGINNSLLHVLGGTQSYTNPFDASGLFYTLDVSNPSSPQEVFSDTIPGIYLAAIANAASAVNINDTIYVVTTSGASPDWVFPQPYYGQVYVYDATGSAGIHFLTSLDAGLWFFDLCIHNETAYIASEWYGIKTLNISDLYHETDQGNTVTGGWAEDADKFGNNLVVANEGYGFKRYDISNPAQPVLTAVNNDPGFCYRIRFSSNGNYIYTSHSTYDGFRIYDASSLSLVSSLPSLRCNGRMLVWNQYVISDYEENATRQLNLINVSNPTSAAINQTITLSVNDMAFNSNGQLFVVNNDSIFVFDIAGGIFVKQHTLPFQNAFQNATSVCISGDTVFAYITLKGLTRYIYNPSTGTLTEDVTTTLAHGEPQRMAADDDGLYLAYNRFGLYAFNKSSITETAYYRTGLDLKGFTTQWGVTDLSCKDGLILLTEYFGQTTLLSADSMYMNLSAEYLSGKPRLQLYPNPFSEYVTIHYPDRSMPYTVAISDITGNVVFRGGPYTTEVVTIHPRIQNRGMYFVKISAEGHAEVYEKLIAE